MEPARTHPINWDEIRLDSGTRFYILGLAPNAARLSVRFFWQNSFEQLALNLKDHYERLEMVHPAYDRTPLLTVWRMVLETVRKVPPGGHAPEARSSFGGPPALICLKQHPLPFYPF